MWRLVAPETQTAHALGLRSLFLDQQLSARVCERSRLGLSAACEPSFRALPFMRSGAGRMKKFKIWRLSYPIRRKQDRGKPMGDASICGPGRSHFHFWHSSDMPSQPDDVRSPGQSRHPATRPRLPFLTIADNRLPLGGDAPPARPRRSSISPNGQNARRR